MRRTDPSVLDSWLNGSLDGDAVTGLAGPDAWRRPVRGASFLVHAIVANRLDLVRDALDQGSDVDLVDTDGVGPLRMAVLKKRERIFRLLAGIPDLNRDAGATPWSPGDEILGEDDHRSASPIFFPSLAFDLARYGTPAMLDAWNAGPSPGWERPMPLWAVLDKRSSYHRRRGRNGGGDVGHALDAALLFNNVKTAAWLLDRTGLNPSLAVLNHGHTYVPSHLDEPPLDPHPARVAVQALLRQPLAGKGPRLMDQARSLEAFLQRSKTPWTHGDAVNSLVESWRVRSAIDGDEGLALPSTPFRRRL